MTKDVDISGGELDIIGEDGDLDAVTNPLVPSDHQLMAELSDVPPAQLMDGGSEDMDMVRGCGRGRVHKLGGVVLVGTMKRAVHDRPCLLFQSDEELLNPSSCGECCSVHVHVESISYH